jgi:hypothetical protein
MLANRRFGLWAILFGAALAVATTDAKALTVFTSAPAFDAATTGLTSVNFQAVTIGQDGYVDYATGPGGGYTDPATGTNFNFPTVPAADGDIDITEQDYYSPDDFPEDFIVAAANTAEYLGANEVITLPSPVTAFGMDISNYGETSTVYTLSNGDSVTNANPPGFGNVAFFGVTDSTPFSSITIPGYETIVLDVSYETAVPLPSSLTAGLALFGLVGAFSLSRISRRLA